ICLVYVILSYTSICFPIYQVVHGKHHRIERTKRCATGSGRTASLPSLALSLSPAQPPGPTKQDRGRAGVYLFFIFFKVHQWVSDVLNCPLRVGLDSRCMCRFFDLPKHPFKKIYFFIFFFFSLLTLYIF